MQYDSEWNNEKLAVDMIDGTKIKNHTVTAIKLVGTQRTYFEQNNLSNIFFDMLAQIQK